MPDPLTPADLAAMREAAEAARDFGMAPDWRAIEVDAPAEMFDVRDDQDMIVAQRIHMEEAQHIAAWSPARVLALLAERDALAARVRRMEEALREAVEYIDQDVHVLNDAGRAMADRWRALAEPGA